MPRLVDYVKGILETIPNRKKRPFLNCASLRAEGSDIAVIEAPTGYGKTVISQAVAIRSLSEGLKCIVSFPLRTLLEDQLSKFRRTISALGLEEELVGARYMQYPESRYLSRPITLTTVDTLSLTLFGIAPEDMERVLKYYDGTSTRSLGHYLFSRAMVLLSDLVLDEVHLLSDSTKSLNFLMALIKIFAEHGGRIVFMSATIPRALKDFLMNECGDSGIKIIEFSENPDEDFLRERGRKKYRFDLRELNANDKFREILNFLREGRREGFKRAIVVFNTVREAIWFYDKVRNAGDLGIGRDKLLLVHSRLTREDRGRVFKRIEGLRGSDEYLVVSTQVIDAGVDISSDIFVTDVAPAASLIQRLGRFLRYDEDSGRVLIWYERPEGESYKGVYDVELVENTLNFLEKNSDVNFHIPASYERLLNEAYPEGFFVVNREEVSRLTSIPMVLEEPTKAIDEFMRLELSFVRESTSVPVIPSSLVKDDLSIERVEGLLIPLDLPIVHSLRPREELVRSEDDPLSLRKRELNESFWRGRGDEVRKRVLRHTLSSSFIAFVVEGRYESDLGMVIGDGEGPQLLE